ncbi:MAG: 30S ribosomal protein S2 [Promethearchaeota archaeon]
MHKKEESRLNEAEPTEDLLVPLEEYLASGVHIGTISGMRDMKEFIYRVRSDGLFVLDVRKTDERIRVGAKFLARYEPETIVCTSLRTYGIFPVTKFCQVIGAKAVTGRFIPGTFTNPSIRGEHEFLEPQVVVITDPNTDTQALKETSRVGAPVVALVDTDNTLENVDYAIPCNNKGRNSLAMVYWLLARQIMRERGELLPEEDFQHKIDAFRAPRGRKAIQQSSDLLI